MPEPQAVQTRNQTSCGSEKHASSFGPLKRTPFTHTALSLHILPGHYAIVHQLFMLHGACSRDSSRTVLLLSAGIRNPSRVQSVRTDSGPTQPTVQWSLANFQGCRFAYKHERPPILMCSMSVHYIIQKTLNNNKCTNALCASVGV
jgi:hypothetical protein